MLTKISAPCTTSLLSWMQLSLPLPSFLQPLFLQRRGTRLLSSLVVSACKLRRFSELHSAQIYIITTQPACKSHHSCVQSGSSQCRRLDVRKRRLEEFSIFSMWHSVHVSILIKALRRTAFPMPYFVHSSRHWAKLFYWLTICPWILWHWANVFRTDCCCGRSKGIGQGQP